MPRSVPEWIGKTPDTAPPPRVKLRVFERQIGRCALCLRIMHPKMKQIYDHMLALINGGENRERNLQMICEICNLHKTGGDVAIKSKTYAIRSKHVGIKRKPKGRPMPGTKASGIRKRMNGTVEEW